MDDYNERTSTYTWQQQEVAVFSLLAQDMTAEKMIVLEGNTTEHRLALQTAGELRQLQVRIAEVKDVEIPEQFRDTNIDEAEIPFNKNVVLILPFSNSYD